MVLREAAVECEPAMVINVRAAKDQLSSLLEAAARGDEVIITSDGQPKARLGPLRLRRRAFPMHWDFLRSQPLQSDGSLSEDHIREERDSRA